MDRRGLLGRIVAGFGAVAAAAFSYPFLRSLVPDTSADMTLEVDVAGLKPGDMKQVRWLGRPVYVVRRSGDTGSNQSNQSNQSTQSTASVASAGSTKRSDPSLKDPDSVRSNQPDFAANSYRARRPDLLLVYANCTHLGCEVELERDRTRRFTGFTCPCHSSRFDTAGRVETGSAADFNLEVPDYDYIGSTTVRLRAARGSRDA